MASCCSNFLTESIIRSSHRRCSVKKAVLKEFANFTGKHRCWSLFLIKLQANFIKKRLQHRCFPVKFAKFLKTPVSKNIWEQLLLHCQRLILLHYFHQKIFQQEMVISKKRNFFVKTLDFLPPWKPGLYKSPFTFRKSIAKLYAVFCFAKQLTVNYF